MSFKTNVALSAICAMIPGVASAQVEAGADVTLPAGAAAKGEGQASTQAAVYEIVVTALKRAERLQEVPASISAVSGEMLAQRGIQDVRDLSKAVPNLVWGENLGGAQVTIRGVGSNVESGVTEPTVAMYVDGLALPRATMSVLRAVDLDRVEVLRGPQGTLYGRNATGGAINFISARPSRTLDGKVEVSTGSRDAWGINGYVSGPLAENVFVRVSGGREKEDGYVRVLNTGQRLGGRNSLFGRIAVLLEPAPNVSLDLAVRYERDKAPVAYQQYISPSVLGTDLSISTDEPNKIVANQPFASRTETFVASATLNWDISDSLTLKSLTGYIDHRSHQRFDADSTLVPLFFSPDFIRPSKSFSQETSLSSKYGRLDFILGAYYFHEDYKGVLPVQLEEFGATPSFPAGTIQSLGQSAKINNAALYGDFKYSINDQLRLNVGLRVNYENSTFGQVYSALPVSAQVSKYSKVDSTKLLPKLALQYELSPDANMYAQYTRGYKSGGGNLPSGGGEFFPLYRPESLDAFEIGLKSQLLDRRFTANFSAFYYRYSDLQITVATPSTATIVQNADARLYGIEGEFRFIVADQMTLTMAPTYLHGTFKNLVTTDPTFGDVVDLDGSDLPRAPKYSITGGIEERIDLGGDFLSQLQLAANLRYNSSMVLRYFNRNAFERQKGYTIIDLSASITDANKMTRLSAFINNVTDQTYKQQSFNFGLGYMGNYGPPRTWGIRLSRRF